LIVEAPDYGHVTTSEAFSYYVWLEAMYGNLTGNWSGVETAWKVMEDLISCDCLLASQFSLNEATSDISALRSL